MTGPPPATAAVRLAVRRALVDLGEAPVAVAVSGGADSLALAAALAFERPGSAALVVDHGLQPGSDAVAARAAEQCRGLGLRATVLAAASPTPPPGDPQKLWALQDPQRPPERLKLLWINGGGGAGSGRGGVGGPEAQARSARYAALDRAVADQRLGAVLLGHTLDDQAETVLLGLARGSGARALAGMAAVRGCYRRPLLGLHSATTAQACAEAGLTPWHDPHNADGAYARVRVRHRVLPVLESELGPGVAAALGRTAAQLREDADALDALTPVLPYDPECAELAVLPGALRARAIKRWAEARTGTALTAAHLTALRALVEQWHGQGDVALPGGHRVLRQRGRLVFARDAG